MSDDFYLVPLARVGEGQKLYDECVQQIISGTQEATLIYNTDGKKAQEQLIAAGYQTTRAQTAKLHSGVEHTWTERILVVRSLTQAKKAFAKLEQRITKATTELWALTPQPGRGHRQIRTKAKLMAKAEAILTKYDVRDYLSYTYQRQQHVETRYIGPGRGSPKRKRRQIRRVRYHITAVTRDEAAIRIAFCYMGWKLYATNHLESDLPFDEAVRLYRAAPRIERHFHLFQGAPIGIQPLYVRNDDQIKGLVRLLSLCVRLLTLIEIVTRRQLQQHSTTLAGLYEGNPKRKTASPTAVRLLRAFRGINRVRWANKGSQTTTPLSALQRQILVLLDISEEIYQVQQHHSSILKIFGRRCSQISRKIAHNFYRVLNQAKSHIQRQN